MDYSFILSGVEGILGKSHKRSKANHAFHCPFCNHSKPKLEINFHTNEKGENQWECWVCEEKGRTIRSLLNKLETPKDTADKILKLLPKGSPTYYKEFEKIELPKEFQPLSTASTTSVTAQIVRNYLYERGLSDIDFIKYNVGYCGTGDYGGRVIIPSYTTSGKLNFFIGRAYDGAYFKYKNPDIDKNLIFFESLINWNLPIVLCEGVFDAMAIKRNAIPILGKNIPNLLYSKILSSTLEDVYIALDKDARSKAIKIAEKLHNQGKRVHLVDLPEKDPSEMGFKKMTHQLTQTIELEFSDILTYKLDL